MSASSSPSGSPAAKITAEQLSKRLKNVTWTGTNYRACCPAHDDANPSLDFRDDDDTLLVICRAGCSFANVMRAWRRLGDGADTASSKDDPPKDQPTRIAKTYDYVNEDGDLAYQKVRYVPKRFSQRRPDGRGGWINNLSGVKQLLYRLPDLKGARKVYAVEGEKDADSLDAIGLTATTNGGGAGKWCDDLTAQLVKAGVKQVVVIPDRDEVGERHGLDVARSCFNAGLNVKVIDLPAPYKDVTEALDAGRKRSWLLKLEAAAPWITAVDILEEHGLIVRTFDEIEPRAVDWLWTGRLARGSLTIMFGDPGLGKSKVAQDVAARLSRGAPWADGESGAPRGMSIVLSAEDNSEYTIRPRLDAMKADVTMIANLEAVKSGDSDRPFSLDTDLPRLQRLIDARRAEGKRVDLIIIDPFSAYLGKTDSWKDADLRRVLGPLAKFAERAKVSVIGVMHSTKNEDRKALMRISGSVAFGAAARIVLGFAKDGGSETRCLIVSIKCNIGPEAPALAYHPRNPANPRDPEFFGITWESDPLPMSPNDVEALFRTARPERDAPAKEFAMKFLRDALAGGPVEASEVKRQAEEADVKGITLNRARWDLGIIARKTGLKGGWTWELPGPRGASSPQGEKS